MFFPDNVEVPENVPERMVLGQEGASSVDKRMAGLQWVARVEEE